MQIILRTLFENKILWISIWTIVQSVTKIMFCSFGYSLYYCTSKPESFDLVFMYLTYFYRDECGTIKLSPQSSFLAHTGLNYIGINTTDYYQFVRNVLEKGLLPQEAYEAQSTIVYISTSTVLETVWMLTTVFLSVTASSPKPRRHLNVLVHIIWLILSSCASLFDVVSAVHFGLNIRHTRGYVKWLKFVGVRNYKDFTQYDEQGLSKLLPTTPSIIFTILSVRMFICWLLNIACFVAVLNIFLNFFQNDQKQKSSRKSVRLICHAGENIDLNTSEARIRNWQLFYGASETTTTVSSSPSDSDYSSSNGAKGNTENCKLETSIQSHRKYIESIKKVAYQDEAYHNPPSVKLAHVATLQNEIIYEGKSSDYLEYQTKRKNNDLRSNSIKLQPLEIDAGRPSIDSNVSTYYRRYSNVSSILPEVTTISSIDRNPELRSQLPWSYVGTDCNSLKRNCAKSYDRTCF